MSITRSAVVCWMVVLAAPAPAMTVPLARMSRSPVALRSSFAPAMVNWKVPAPRLIVKGCVPERVQPPKLALLLAAWTASRSEQFGTCAVFVSRGVDGNRAGGVCRRGRCDHRRHDQQRGKSNAYQATLRSPARAPICKGENGAVCSGRITVVIEPFSLISRSARRSCRTAVPAAGTPMDETRQVDRRPARAVTTVGTRFGVKQSHIRVTVPTSIISAALVRASASPQVLKSGSGPRRVNAVQADAEVEHQVRRHVVVRLASTGRPQCLAAHRDVGARGVEVLTAPARAGGP